MALDIIYLLIATPITIAVMYAWHCIKINHKRFEEMPEAKPYEFEKDKFNAGYDEFSRTIHEFKFYKGKAK
jgi:hypothetical protein